jgi:hypothetical protein
LASHHVPYCDRIEENNDAPTCDDALGRHHGGGGERRSEMQHISELVAVGAICVLATTGGFVYRASGAYGVIASSPVTTIDAGW